MIKSLLLNLLVAVVTFCLFYAALETTIRLRQTRQGVSFFQSPSEFTNSETGWEGTYFPGNKNSNKTKILFLGDSFTQLLGVLPEDSYFSVAAQSLNAEAFAYGGKGYGNLQELLILKRLLPEVQPDLIVLQLCVNDLLNNSWELERRSYLQNALLPRPYLQDDKVELKYPRRFPETRLFLETNSRLAHYLSGKFELFMHGLAKEKRISTIEHEIEGNHGRFPLFEEAVRISDQIFEKILEASSGIPVVAFLADEIPPWNRAFHEIAERRNMPLFPQIASAIMEQEKKRRVMRLSDKVHWNAAGHAVAGQALAIEIKNLFPELFNPDIS